MNAYNSLSYLSLNETKNWFVNVVRLRDFLSPILVNSCLLAPSSDLQTLFVNQTGTIVAYYFPEFFLCFCYNVYIFLFFIV